MDIGFVRVAAGCRGTALFSCGPGGQLALSISHTSPNIFDLPNISKRKSSKCRSTAQPTVGLNMISQFSDAGQIGFRLLHAVTCLCLSSHTRKNWACRAVQVNKNGHMYGGPDDSFAERDHLWNESLTFILILCNHGGYLAWIEDTTHSLKNIALPGVLPFINNTNPLQVKSSCSEGLFFFLWATSRALTRVSFVLLL